MTDTRAHLTDFGREIGATEEVVVASDLVACGFPRNVSSQTRTLLQSIYASVDPLRRRSGVLLTAVPRDTNGDVDLRLVEGSGFYEQLDEFWLYHKGSGSVEAAAFYEALGITAVRYRGFGAEIAGAAAGFSSSRILGIKMYRQMVHELCASFIVLADFIEREGLQDVQQVVGQCTIPLSVVRLSGLAEVLENNIDEKPAAIRRFYDGAKEARAPAKCVLVVPSPSRGTDEYPVEGKWLESHNVFVRSKSLGRVRLHNRGGNPYWRKHEARCRGRGIRRLLDAGVIHQVWSCHLQNLYACPDASEKPFSPMADACDLMFISHFARWETERLLLHLLASPRCAESLGPSPFPDQGVSMSTALACSRAFFEGFLDGDTRDELASLFTILPESLACALAKRLAPTIGQSPDAQVAWQDLVESLPYGSQVLEFVNTEMDGHCGVNNRLLQPALELRSPNLVRMISEGLWGEGGNDYTRLRALAGRFSDPVVWSDHSRDEIAIWRAAIELAAHSGAADLSRLLQTASRDSPRQALASAWSSYFNKLKSSGSDASASWLEDWLEELMHTRAGRIRTALTACALAGDLSGPLAWCRNVINCADELVVDPHQMLDVLLIFLYKRKGVLEAIQNADAPSFIAISTSTWDRVLNPVVREYPEVRLSRSARRRLARDPQSVFVSAEALTTALLDSPA